MTTYLAPSKEFSNAVMGLHSELINVGAGGFKEFVASPDQMLNFVQRVADAIWNEPGHREVLDFYGVDREKVGGLYVHAFREAVESKFTIPAIMTLVQIYASPYGLASLLKSIGDMLERSRAAGKLDQGKDITAASIRLFYLTLAKEGGQ